MKKLILFLALALVSCSNAPEERFEIQGTVRNVWFYGSIFHITIEFDDGKSKVFRTWKQPPVWKDEHVKITAQEDTSLGFEDNGIYILEVTRIDK